MDSLKITKAIASTGTAAQVRSLAGVAVTDLICMFSGYGQHKAVVRSQPLATICAQSLHKAVLSCCRDPCGAQKSPTACFFWTRWAD